jgi:hypothetical protein
MGNEGRAARWISVRECCTQPLAPTPTPKRSTAHGQTSSARSRRRRRDLVVVLLLLGVENEVRLRRSFDRYFKGS